MNVDNKEVQKFDDISYRWWDPEGPFKPLHMLNPVRVNFIKNSIDLKIIKGSYLNKLEDIFERS